MQEGGGDTRFLLPNSHHQASFKPTKHITISPLRLFQGQRPGGWPIPYATLTCSKCLYLTLHKLNQITLTIPKKSTTLHPLGSFTTPYPNKLRKGLTHFHLSGFNIHKVLYTLVGFKTSILIKKPKEDLSCSTAFGVSRQEIKISPNKYQNQ